MYKISKVFTLSAILVFALLGSIRANAQSVAGSISGGVITRGATAKGVVTMSIPGGLHVNSNRPSSEYSIPTTVHVTGSGVKVGNVSYPHGSNRKFEFSESAINVYEGKVRFPFSVTVPESFKGNSIRLHAVVKYQACTNEVCYPPKSKEIIFTARVH